jgi:transcriptional regulator with XRE-family HTH domain
MAVVSASLIRDVAEAICFVERHTHLDPNRRTRADRPCSTSLNVGARVFGVLRLRQKGGEPAPLAVTAPADDFGAWLREQMTAQGMTQRGLANLAGLDHGTVSRLLNSNRTPLLATARKIERALGLGGRRDHDRAVPSNRLLDLGSSDCAPAGSLGRARRPIGDIEGRRTGPPSSGAPRWVASSPRSTCSSPCRRSRQRVRRRLGRR